MYLHGGGYIFPLVHPHWTIIRALIEATGAAVTVPLYPRAPEHDHRHAWAMVGAVYEELLHTGAGKRLALAGDSAGTHDIFVADARSFHARATAQRADLQYFEYEGGFHVFMGARSTRESRDVYKRVAEFLAPRPAEGAA